MNTNRQLLIIIRGLPGSGKSTLAAILARRNPFRWYEADHFFYDEDGDYIFDKTKLKEAHTYCQQGVRASLENDYSVIVSDTFSQVWEMQPYLDMAKEFGIQPQIIETKGTWASIHDVPQETIEAMKQRWESYP